MATTYTIDPAHSNANFTVRHLMITNVRGGFGKVTGTVVYDPSDLAASTVEASIDATTISTFEEARDNHLKSADFLNIANFPTIDFKSTSIVAQSDGAFTVTGNLSLHGVTKPVVLNVEPPSAESKDPWGNTRTGIEAATKIKRSDYGIEFNAPLETGGVLIGDDIKIEIALSLIKGQ
jgi:polyisoprenoid-binding protein YceI